MEIPEQLKDLHRAVVALSQIDLHKACATLRELNAINFADAREIGSALNSLIQRAPEVLQ